MSRVSRDTPCLLVHAVGMALDEHFWLLLGCYSGLLTVMCDSAR